MSKGRVTYPFLPTRTQVWRKQSVKGTHPSVVIKMPEMSSEAKNLTATSTQQALGVRFLRNAMALSYAAASGSGVFHLGGLPGAGKTTTVKELIAELEEAHLIDTERGDILLCTKSNSAKASLMSACETTKGRCSLLYPENAFATLNSGFSIPVVHNKNEVTHERVSSSASWLRRKIVDYGLGNLQFLGIDEYTMSSCREIVYIDAVLRMIKFRPDVPFGGVFVLLLGDNRQNSAVVEDNNSYGQNHNKKEGDKKKKQENKKEEEEEEEEEGGGGGGEKVFNKLYTDLLLKILKVFASKDCFGKAKFLKMMLNHRLEGLLKRQQIVTSVNNDIIMAYERQTVTAPKPEYTSPNVIDDDDGDDFDDDDAFSNEELLKIVNADVPSPTSSSASLTLNSAQFSVRCRRIAEANSWFKNKGKVGQGQSTLEVLRDVTLLTLVEEGLKVEIEHVRSLKNMKGSDLEQYARDTFNDIIKTATKAMVEIDYSGREKMYVVSSLSERFKDVHVTSLMDEEILNAKLLYGTDQECCDALPFQSEQNRTMAIAACVRNAFFREGCDIKGEVPVAVYFRDNLEKLAEFLAEKNNVKYKDLLTKSAEIKTQLENEVKLQQPQIKMVVDDDLVSDDDDYYHYYDDADYEGKMISRKDVPSEVNVDSTTNDRVGVLVSFHIVWYRWLTSSTPLPSDLVRSRLWHLYTLVRMQQAKGFGNILPSFDQAAVSGRLFFPTASWKSIAAGETNSEYHDEFWLRVLSMPVVANGDKQQTQLLPAYSSYLSAMSRTYIMSSLKRVNAVKHAYALMYGLSLFDMTVDVMDLIDSRKIPSLAVPVGYTSEFNLEEYFGSIFPSIVEEYLMKKPEEVIHEAKSVEEVKGSLRISHAAAFASHANVKAPINYRQFGDAIKYTKKSVVLAMRMLTSISKGNLRSLLLLKRKANDDDDEPDMKRQKTTTTTLADRLEEKPKRAVTDNNCLMGAITLTRSHAQKNAVSQLVEKTIINQSALVKKMGGDNTIKTIRCDTKFVVKNIDVSYINYATSVRRDHMEKILEGIRACTMSGKHFIDSTTDFRLLRESQNPKQFTRVLLTLKNKVTQVKSVDLYQGQNVVFTNTNIRPYIHGTNSRFTTKDTGVVTDIVMKDGQAIVFVAVERLGKEAIQLSEGEQFLGVNNDGRGPRNAYVKYIPLDSSQAMTIYSCQGQTFSRDTIVDLSGASTQDAYVAVTRNNDPLNLYVVQTHETERKNLAYIKYSMGKDRSSLFPLGGLRKLGGEEFVNYDAVNVAEEVRQSILMSEDNAEESAYSSCNPTRDMVTAAQRFIMSRSGNAMAFNSFWMINTGKILRADGDVNVELGRLNDFFFGSSPATKEYSEFYATVTHDKMMELFTAVTRSVSHYAMTGAYVKYPSLKFLEDYLKKGKNRRDYVKIHPSFLNTPPRKDSVASLFYDVAPHSTAAMVLQFYAHYLFLVYEQVHMCNASFAFLPSTSPVFNKHTRPEINKEELEPPLAYVANVPEGMGYESQNYANAKDGGLRDPAWRIPITTIDHLGDNIQNIRKSALAASRTYDVTKATTCTDFVSKSMQHNLRRVGKFCRPAEACGLSRHGIISVATDSAKIEQTHVHESDRGWISLSDEANMFGLLTFMTRLAAASGVTVVNVEDVDATEHGGQVFAPMMYSGVPAEYQLRLSNEVLWCGQAAPMKRVQFTLHCRKNKAAEASRLKVGAASSSPNMLFSQQFEKEALKGRTLKAAKVVMITEMLGHSFGQHSTSEIRSTLFHGVGKVVRNKQFEGDDILKQVEKFVFAKLKPLTFMRVSFFISAEY